MTTNARGAELVPYDSVNDFSKAALPFLLADEALNNLQLGVLRFLQQPGAVPAAFLATVRDRRGEVSGVVTQNHGHGLLVSGRAPPSTEALVRALRARALDPPGVFGSPDFAKAFAEDWCARRGLVPKRVAKRGVFSLKELRRPEPIAGRFEQASLEALPLVIEWTAAFHAQLPNIGPPPAIELLETRIRNGLIFVWIGDDGRPASMVVTGRETPNGAVIQFVYTAPALRGRGFASSSVAAACETIFARGKQHCALFADLENTTAIGVYERLGFERVGFADHYLFERGA